jgi:hypothetical protein
MCKSSLILQNSISSTLVDLGLGQAGDLLSAVLDLSVCGLEAAKYAGALLDGVVAGQRGGGNAVKSAVA